MSRFEESLEWNHSDQPVEIKAHTVLPAIRKDIIIKTTDGLDLVGEIALPADGNVEATLVTLHPLPTAGGFMESHLYKKASFRLPALAQTAVIRFNTRGTSSVQGTSQGEFSEGIQERLDVEAAVGYAVEKGLPNIWIVGWSFGTELALKYASDPAIIPYISGIILLSPPLHRTSQDDLMKWNDNNIPVYILVPEEDDYLRPLEAKQQFACLNNAQIIEGEGAKHLWVGEKSARFVLDNINNIIFDLPENNSLPETWMGTFAQAV